MLNDHAPRHESQSHNEKERAKALRWLLDNKKYILQPEFRYTKSEHGSAVLRSVPAR